MSKSSDFRQDLIVSIRYRNDLPPPPMPPKLLDIETGGIQQYLVPGFAASIAKREEPNIEADAEGGMPIDVIGMYGYFDGDESSIMAPEVAPPLDPEDEALMLTLEQLKAGGVKDTSNFLRKTQYMTSSTAPQQDTRQQPRTRKPSQPKATPLAREDKENIKRNIRKAFDLAYPQSAKAKENSIPISQADRNAWDNPVHPEKKGLKPVDFFPVLPDYDAATRSGQTWNVLRFEKPPLPAIKGHRDNRLDAGFLMTSKHPDKQAAWQRAKDAFIQDPTKYADPGVEPAIWSLWLPKDQATTPMMRKLLDSRNADHSDEGVLARIQDVEHPGEVMYDRSRVYTNARTDERNKDHPTRQVVMVLDASTQQAHYYPIGHVNSLKTQVTPTVQERFNAAQLEETLPDSILVTVTDPDPEVLAIRYRDRADFDPSYEDTYAEIYAEFERFAAERKAAEEAAAAEDAAGDDANEDVDMADD